MAPSPFDNNMDPLAGYRRTMENARKIMDPTAGYRRYLERTKPVDPLGTRRIMDQARMAMDPMGEYRRIVSDFSGLVGTPPPPSPMQDTSELESAPASSASQSGAFSLTPSLVFNLLLIAWVCRNLIVSGADTGPLHELLLDAVQLAIYFFEKSRGGHSEN